MPLESCSDTSNKLRCDLRARKEPAPRQRRVISSSDVSGTLPATQPASSSSHSHRPTARPSQQVPVCTGLDEYPYQTAGAPTYSHHMAPQQPQQRMVVWLLPGTTQAAVLALSYCAGGIEVRSSIAGTQES
jgi:hypothetical protein